MSSEELMEIFELGVDYGRLLEEQEKRQIRSNEWRENNLESFYKAMNMIGEFMRSEYKKSKT